MKVAIACCGLEHVRRGYESCSRELFGALSGRANVTLFKGSGKRAENEVVVPCSRRDWLGRILEPNRAFYWEQVTFALALFPLLRAGKIDLVHFSENTVGNVLARLVRKAGLKVKLLQSNGGPLHPRHFRPEVNIHQVCQSSLDLALSYGISPGRMYLAPHGIQSSQFSTTLSQAETRRSFGIPIDKFVILSLAALNRTHKRLDYLIREVAAIRDSRFFLCMAGEPTSEQPELELLARQLLPGRHMFLSVPRAAVTQLLSSADLFVLASLQEGFGMVLLEALAAGVPVIAHQSEHFAWVLGEAGLLADLGLEGSLTCAIRRAAAKPELRADLKLKGRELIMSRYDWQVLAPRYLSMYEAVLES
jgi:glycosyltransferase involved in cell wall biosynthesis